MSPKSPLAKLGLYPRPKTLKVMVLGQSGVGKSAMVVRFITKRYIGEYDPTLEKIYTFHTVIDNEMVYFDILDTAGQSTDSEFLGLEANIKWAEAFILMYSVTDKCSFDECYRLKFLINYNKRKRRLGGGSVGGKDGIGDIPVVLVGNKIDQVEDRMVSMEEGQKRSKEIGCVCFYEISVRESIEQVWEVFCDVCRFWRLQSKNPLRLRRTASDKEPISPDASKFSSSSSSSGVSSYNLLPSSRKPSSSSGRRWTEVDLDEKEEYKDSAGANNEMEPFRERASTDGYLHFRPWKWKNFQHPSSSSSSSTMDAAFLNSTRSSRRMSISMRGTNASC